MAQANIVQDGVDRINDAFKSVDTEFQRVQKRLNTRRRSLEKELSTRRKDVEKRTRKGVKRLRTELRKNPVFKRAEKLQKDVTKQMESTVDDLLGLFQIASKSDLDRIDRKLNQLSRRLKEFEKTRSKANGAGPSAAASQ